MSRFTEYAAALRALLSNTVFRMRPDEQNKSSRNALAKLSRALRPQNGRSFTENLSNIYDSAVKFETITSGYLTPQDIAAGKTGDFDSMNLLSWLEIVKKTDIPYVPARVIASLTTPEMQIASGKVSEDLMKKSGIMNKIRKLAAEHPDANKDDDAEPTHDQVLRKLATAMETVQENEMVRYTRCGGTNLKTIAGAGIAGPNTPTVRFSPNLETGAGWLRRGNMRVIDVEDMRIINTAALTPETYTHEFVARPWIPSSRYFLAEDPHRTNTPVRGPGAWPAEWRAFVCNGVVTGVSAYYSWAHPNNDEDALMAKEVRLRAQKIVDTAIAMKLRPATYDIDQMLPDSITGFSEKITSDPNYKTLEDYIRDVPPGHFNCTLDFLETKDGPTFLEAGPPIIPIGTPCQGAHPLGFATGMPFEPFAYPDVNGVCLASDKTMNTSDIPKFHEFDRTEHILSWDQLDARINTLKAKQDETPEQN